MVTTNSVDALGGGQERKRMLGVDSAPHGNAEANNAVAPGSVVRLDGGYLDDGARMSLVRAESTGAVLRSLSSRGCPQFAGLS